MEQVFTDIFGVQNHLSTLQEAARAILIFSYGLVLLRISGPRMFGHWSALDFSITIMIGSALARAMTGSAPLVGTMAAAVMAIPHVANSIRTFFASSPSARTTIPTRGSLGLLTSLLNIRA